MCWGNTIEEETYFWEIKLASKEIINLGSGTFYTINEANNVLMDVIGTLAHVEILLM